MYKEQQEVIAYVQTYLQTLFHGILIKHFFGVWHKWNQCIECIATHESSVKSQTFNRKPIEPIQICWADTILNVFW